MEVYADNAATTKMCHDAIAIMAHYETELYGNPSSSHSMGTLARRAIDCARRTIAEIINAEPEQIFFTSGGSECNNLALNTCLQNGKYICTSKIEHPSILNNPHNQRRISVDINGIVNINELKSEMTDADIVSIMYVNNEIGTIQPIDAISSLCTAEGVIFHTDAVQAIGHVDVDVQNQGIDLMSASAHKFRGPKGIGFLYCRDHSLLNPLIYGGGQEYGMRSGTQNVPAIMGMAEALKYCYEHLDENKEYVAKLRDTLAERLLNDVPNSHINGSMSNRVSGNLNIRFDNVDGETLASMLSGKEIYVSAGSACHAGSVKPSHVLTAIGLSSAEAKSAIRISLNECNTTKQIDYMSKWIAKCVEALRSNNTMPIVR